MKLPIRINLIKILSHRHAQRFILMLVLNPIKLTLCPRILPCRKQLIRWELLHYWGLRRFWSTVLGTAPWSETSQTNTPQLSCIIPARSVFHRVPRCCHYHQNLSLHSYLPVVTESRWKVLNWFLVGCSFAFYSRRDWTQGLKYARQTFYSLAMSSALVLELWAVVRSWCGSWE